ncbi:MAG: hypothetical protein P1U68_11995 [Verrucomicrobiales bacterium]|nr:hypothetical protein [Verrucomicrobiales bacterium]
MKSIFFRAVLPLCVSLCFTGCGKPKLKSEVREDSAEESEPAIRNGEPLSISEKRDAVVGRVFERLTLGERGFSSAEILDITDQAIIVSHEGGVESVSWTGIPENVRELWGYDRAAEVSDQKVNAVKPQSPREEFVQPSIALPSGRAPDESGSRFAEMAQKEKMLGAQLEGIRTLESDLSRHSLTLNDLRAQLQSIRAKESNRGSGGVRIERLNGQSVIVDRRREMSDIQARIKGEEQLVAQFSKSLEKARQTHQRLQAEVIRLQQQ